MAADWLGDRVEDFAKWIANLIRYLPARLGRIALTLVFAAVGLVTFVPLGVRVWRRGGRANFIAWLRSGCAGGRCAWCNWCCRRWICSACRSFLRCCGGPQPTRSPLTGAEISAVASVLGPFALRYQDIRVAQRGILRLVFKANGGRAFATFHTVNLPATGDHQRANVDILLHELVHVYQYERAGSRYFAEALLAQQEEGYGYGGRGGLAAGVRPGQADARLQPRAAGADRAGLLHVPAPRPG